MQYKMIVYSNPIEGKMTEYLDWYAGQHIHDMLQIPGYKGCQWYKLSESQLNGTKEAKGYRYVLIWDIESDNIDDVWAEILKAREEGRITYSDAFDKATYCTVVEPVTNYVSTEQARGLDAQQVKELSGLTEEAYH